MSSEINIGFNIHDFEYITIRYNSEYKIVNLQTIEFIKKSNYELDSILYLSDMIDNDLINYENLKKIIQLVVDKFLDFEYWWFDYQEIRIDYDLHKGYRLINTIFKQLNLFDKIKFVDNNLKNNSQYNIGFNYTGVPSMVGQTCRLKFNFSKIEIKKKFICLNRLDKYHRQVIFDFLNETCKDDSYISYTPHDEFNYRHRKLEKIEYTETNKRNYISNYQNYSFCNIVTESSTASNIIHITEKTDKSISACQPFILVSGPHYLKKLKELGFKTFDKWWDESYDDELNLDNRLEMIKKVIKQIDSWSYEKCNSIYHEMIPTLTHNLELSKKYGTSTKYHLEYWNLIKLKTS